MGRNCVFSIDQEVGDKANMEAKSPDPAWPTFVTCNSNKLRYEPTNVAPALDDY